MYRITIYNAIQNAPMPANRRGTDTIQSAAGRLSSMFIPPLNPFRFGARLEFKEGGDNSH